MIKQYVAGFQHLELTCFALLLFFTVFSGVLIWVFRNGNREHYKTLERLPLGD